MITLRENFVQQYSEAGFQVKRVSEDILVFLNKFSVHFIFFCGNTEHFSNKYSKFHDYFKVQYLKGNLAPDIYWNFYEIYVFENGETEGFLEFKERTEMDFQMSRKYVSLAGEIDKLPLFHLPLHTRKRRITESPWEEEWRGSIGEELYDKILDSPKSKIEEVLKEYLNDKFYKD